MGCLLFHLVWRGVGVAVGAVVYVIWFGVVWLLFCMHAYGRDVCRKYKSRVADFWEVICVHVLRCCPSVFATRSGVIQAGAAEPCQKKVVFC